MNFIKTLNELLTRTLIVLCCLTLSVTGFAQTPNITASIEEVVVSQTNEVDGSGNYLLDYAAHLSIDIELPPVGPNETIKKLTDIVGVSFDLDVEHFGDLHVDGEDLLYCNGATGHAIGTLGSGTIRVQTFFQNGMAQQGVNCYDPDPTKAAVGLIVDSSQKSDIYYMANFGDCANNSRNFTETLSISNAYYMLSPVSGNGEHALSGTTVTENHSLPCTYPEFNLTDFNRSWTHVCTSGDGSLTINWPSNYNDVYISMDGGASFESTGGSNSFTANNLTVDDYDIRVKLGKYGYGFTLDDINIIDLSHEVTRSWGHPTCGNSNGWLQINWIKKALPNIKISIDGGETYTTIPAANEDYRVEDLPEGDYDIRLKWSYAPFACPTQLDDINLRSQWVHCKMANNINEQLIRVYPNPTSDKVSIDISSKDFDKGYLSIYDLAGKKVYSTTQEMNQETLELNVEHLDNGIYIVSFTDDKEEKTHIEKLTINK